MPWVQWYYVEGGHAGSLQALNFSAASLTGVTALSLLSEVSGSSLAATVRILLFSPSNISVLWTGESATTNSKKYFHSSGVTGHLMLDIPSEFRVIKVTLFPMLEFPECPEFDSVSLASDPLSFSS